jgi:hypothetical protein
MGSFLRHLTILWKQTCLQIQLTSNATILTMKNINNFESYASKCTLHCDQDIKVLIDTFVEWEGFPIASSNKMISNN